MNMKRMLAHAALSACLLPGLAAAAEQAKPATAAAKKAAAPARAPAGKTRSHLDARSCLELSENLAVMRCAEKFR